MHIELQVAPSIPIAARISSLYRNILSLIYLIKTKKPAFSRDLAAIGTRNDKHALSCCATNDPGDDASVHVSADSTNGFPEGRGRYITKRETTDCRNAKANRPKGRSNQMPCLYWCLRALLSMQEILGGEVLSELLEVVRFVAVVTRPLHSNHCFGSFGQ